MKCFSLNFIFSNFCTVIPFMIYLLGLFFWMTKQKYLSSKDFFFLLNFCKNYKLFLQYCTVHNIKVSLFSNVQYCIQNKTEIMHTKGFFLQRVAFLLSTGDWTFTSHGLSSLYSRSSYKN